MHPLAGGFVQIQVIADSHLERTVYHVQFTPFPMWVDELYSFSKEMNYLYTQSYPQWCVNIYLIAYMHCIAVKTAVWRREKININGIIPIEVAYIVCLLNWDALSTPQCWGICPSIEVAARASRRFALYSTPSRELMQLIVVWVGHSLLKCN